MAAVYYSAVNPIDSKISSGAMQQGLSKQFPFIPSWELSGIVVQVGTSVTKFKKGDEVYNMPNFQQGGSYAPFIAINENEVAFKPQTITFIQAAAVPMVADAAYTSLFKFGKIKANQKILIHGAAGAVSSFAVQMAKNAGAYVIGTAAGEGIALLQSLGADEIINYTTADFSIVVNNVDIVLDLVGGETQMKSFGIIKKDGLLLSTVMPPSNEKAASAAINAAFVFTSPHQNMLAEIAAMIDNGKLKITTPAVLPLAEAKKAHEMIENRTAKCKVVLELSK